MRSFSMFLAAVLALSSHGSVAQTITILQPDILLPDDPLQGEVIGIGADGTTLLVSNIPTETTDDIAYTETVVQDATHISIVLDVANVASQTISLGVQCTYASLDPSATAADAQCVLEGSEAADGFTSVSTVTEAASIVGVPIAVSTASGVSSSGSSGSSGNISSGLKTTSGPTSGASGTSISGSSSATPPTASSGTQSTALGAGSLVALPVLSALAIFIL